MNRALLASVSCLLAGLLAIGWWLFRPTELAPDAPPEPTAAVPTTPAAPSLPVATTRDAAANAPERTLADAAAPAASMDHDDAATRHLEGTIVVTDPNGSEHVACNGFVELELLVPTEPAGDVSSLASFTTPVVNGHWQADVTKAATGLQVGTIDLDQRPARCSDKFALPNEQPSLQLRATWLPMLQLRVIADDTGIDLVELKVVQSRDWMHDGFRHPGNNDLDVVLEHGRSPLQLQPRGAGDSVRYWVKAPGFAWDQIELATGEPGERTLRLAPGGDVEVTFVGEVPRGAVLRARPPQPQAAPPTTVPRRQDRPMAEIEPGRPGPTRFDALPAGSWTLSLEKGDWFREQILFGEATVMVAPGTITPATITVCPAAQMPATIQVHGTLTLSPTWGDDVELELEPAGEIRAWATENVSLPLADMEDEGNARHRWGDVGLLAGRWQVTVHGTEYRTIVEVGPGRSAEVNLVVPEPNEVRVRVVDAMTGQPIPGANPTWYAVVEQWGSGWGHANMQAIDGDWYRCLACAGKIVVHCHPDDYAVSGETYEVRPGTNEFVVRMGRVCGVDLVLKDGDVTIPWPDDAFANMEHTTTKTGVAYWSGNKVAAKEPGEHLLTIRPIDGYEPIPPRKVVIEPAQWTRVVIELRRKQ